MDTKIVIVGAGLSGLFLATRLIARGRRVMILEARDRPGGRILTQRVDGAGFDLGPAWFWPGQPRMARLLTDLGLSRFDQYAAGALTFEDDHGRVQTGRGFASMQGSYRVAGGMGALIDGLCAKLPEGALHLSTPVLGLTRTATGITAQTPHGDISARTGVLSLPPRIAAGLAFSPALPAADHDAMRIRPTWMAGQAKAIALYDRPIWREAGLSGDAMSRRGPMVELHDASPAAGGPYALFGFIGVPPQARRSEDALRHALTDQLGRLFGPDAAAPRALLIKDWASDAHTATAEDHGPLAAHPTYGLPPALSRIWDGRLTLSGTETAPQFGGYLEGALEAAENSLALLQSERIGPT